MAKPKTKTLLVDPLALRVAEGQTQAIFWRRFGVTQSGGSRYEAGRPMPKPLRMLLALERGLATPAEVADGTLAARV